MTIAIKITNCETRENANALVFDPVNQTWMWLCADSEMKTICSKEGERAVVVISEEAATPYQIEAADAFQKLVDESKKSAGMA